MNAWRIIGLLGLAGGAAVVTSWAVLFNVAYLLAGLLVVTWLWSRLSLTQLDVRREVRSDRVQVGQEIVERLALRNRSGLPRLWVAVVDRTTLPGHVAGRVINVAPHAVEAWTLRTVARRRGAYLLGPIELRAADPFGCFLARRGPGATGIGAHQVLVLPATEPLPDFHLPSRDLPGGARTRSSGAPSAAQASSVRDYVPGDPVSRVHWRSTARVGRLIVKQVEHEPSADVWLALDLHAEVQRGSGDQGTEETLIAVAASIARRYLDAGRAVGLAMHGERHVVRQPDRGERQLMHLLEGLAVARAIGPVPFADLLRSDTMRPDRNAALVAITPSLDLAWPSALRLATTRGARAVAIVIEPSTFGGGESSLLLVGELASIDMPTYLVKRGEPLAEILVTR